MESNIHLNQNLILFQELILKPRNACFKFHCNVSSRSFFYLEVLAVLKIPNRSIFLGKVSDAKIFSIFILFFSFYM